MKKISAHAVTFYSTKIDVQKLLCCMYQPKFDIINALKFSAMLMGWTHNGITI